MTGKTSKLLLALGALAVPALSLLDIEEFLPQKEKWVFTETVKATAPLEITLAYPRSFYVASVELGNPADQKTFLDFFRKSDSTIVSAFRGRDLAFKTDFDYRFWDTLSLKERLDSVYLMASEKTSKIADALRSADVVHISGHHSGASPLIFGGELVDSSTGTYNITSGIKIDEFPVNENAKMVFLLYCSGDRLGVTFGGKRMHDKFPNALILGYGLKSPAGESNSKLLDTYFSLLPENFGDMPKADLASLWIKAAQKIYPKGRRDCRAVWPDKNILFEYHSDNKVYKYYLK